MPCALNILTFATNMRRRRVDVHHPYFTSITSTTNLSRHCQGPNTRPQKRVWALGGVLTCALISNCFPPVFLFLFLLALSWFFVLSWPASLVEQPEKFASHCLIWALIIRSVRWLGLPERFAWTRPDERRKRRIFKASCKTRMMT